VHYSPILRMLGDLLRRSRRNFRSERGQRTCGYADGVDGINIARPQAAYDLRCSRCVRRQMLSTNSDPSLVRLDPSIVMSSGSRLNARS
jgi:hypothetical protein